MLDENSTATQRTVRLELSHADCRAGGPRRMVIVSETPDDLGGKIVRMGCVSCGHAVELFWIVEDRQVPVAELLDGIEERFFEG